MGDAGRERPAAGAGSAGGLRPVLAGLLAVRAALDAVLSDVFEMLDDGHPGMLAYKNLPTQLRRGALCAACAIEILPPPPSGLGLLR